MSTAALRAAGLGYRVDGAVLLDGVDLDVRRGELLGIVGPNGAGKSTLLKAILGLVKPLTGWVKVFGEPYSRRRSWVGYVPQRESVDWDRVLEDLLED